MTTQLVFGQSWIIASANKHLKVKQIKCEQQMVTGWDSENLYTDAKKFQEAQAVTTVLQNSEFQT